ncbi:acyltransferase [Exilibacterium tricleocarpae]|uniref:Acyltransferase n=1 Tax=Exilibacterium tricleocarpae TaxID=2591008 RepID=A0A545T3H1_9GAMM|nr:acyltransferase [Exilibacterium tricleocarpae]TQV71767.1 acyltransferase [Exilibacterium tricleocarpae]
MNSHRIYTLDVLRIFAALWVFLYHLTAMSDRAAHYEEIVWFTKFGFLGVPLFFMISGFVICNSTINRSFWEFSVSRFTRLYPTYWAAMIFTTAIVYILVGDKSPISLAQFLTNLTMLNDYLRVSDIDPVYWTLHIELQFYAWTALLLALNWLHKAHLWLVAWLSVTLLYLVVQQPFFMSWFISPAYSCYLIAGVVFFLASRHGFTRFYTILLALSFSIAIYYLPQQFENKAIPVQSVDYVWGGLLIAAFYLIFTGISQGKLNMKPFWGITFLSGISYPLYLVHHRAGRHLFYEYIESTDPYLLLFMILATMVSVSSVLYLAVDKNLSGKLRRRLLALPQKINKSRTDDIPTTTG